MTEAVLEVRDLEVEFQTGGQVVRAVNGVSFRVEEGKTLAIQAVMRGRRPKCPRST